MSDWILLRHEETGGETRIPASEDVLAQHVAKGWRPVDPPEPAPFVPVPNDRDQPEDEWVDLVHPDTGGAQRLPNHPDALTGALEAGWQLPNYIGSREDLVQALGVEETPADDADNDEPADSESKE